MHLAVLAVSSSVSFWEPHQNASIQQPGLRELHKLDRPGTEARRMQ